MYGYTSIPVIDGAGVVLMGDVGDGEGVGVGCQSGEILISEDVFSITPILSPAMISGFGFEKIKNPKRAERIGRVPNRKSTYNILVKKS